MFGRVAAAPSALFILLCLAAGPTTGADGEADRPRPPFPLYLGKETPRIRSATEVSGASASVVLDAVLQGDSVQHDFVIRNDGAQVLELRNARACKGCILEGYTREIAPGGQGRISILFLTDSVGGETIAGTVTAETTDPGRPQLRLDVSLTVKEFASLSPYRVWLEGRVGESIVERCTVVPNQAYPFEITGIKRRKAAWYDVDYEEIALEGRRAYRITLTNTRSKPGPYHDILFVQTNHPERPEFKIRVEGRIEE